jgi:hypothetical protein
MSARQAAFAVGVPVVIGWGIFVAGTVGCGSATADDGPFHLAVPTCKVADRVSLVRAIGPKRRETWAELEGPGCINHLWITLSKPVRPTMINRKVILRIYFDGSPVPHVEAPVGDFFGAMHGVDYYDINTEFLSVQPLSGYNCYFQMPFARSARIEFETGEEGSPIYLQVDWHRYPEAELKEPRRFCARWRRECPTQRYGEDFLMLDADGPGQLIGFVYGVRLMDNVDRWSHGGSENIYLDGDGEHPACLRGIGGEDTFGASYGGALHPPETHWYTGMPYYVHEDVGEARPAQRLVGYRFFVKDAVPFAKSIHMRFGCMENDICATVYWYQAGPVRPFVKMPPFAQLLPGAILKRGEMDEPLPESGSWLVTGPLENAAGEAIRQACGGSGPMAAATAADGWTERKAFHGFLDFNHLYRPGTRGAGSHYADKAAAARCILESPADTNVTLRFAWDDHLVVRIDNQPPLDLGDHPALRDQTIQAPFRKGRHLVQIVLSNTPGTNHGGWAFAFRANTAEGTALVPRAR